MMNSQGELIRKATHFLDKYQADKQCEEAFTEDVAKSLQGDISTSDQNLILDVIHGCIVHKKLLDVVVNNFYVKNGKFILKADHNQFAVICYLAMFHHEELGLQCFSTIVKSLDTSKMYKFLSFFFNVTNLTTWIQGEWNQIYDAAYVEGNFIAPLLRWCHEIQPLLEHLANRMNRVVLPKKSSKRATEPQEFDLTKPKPQAVLAPEPVPHQERALPVPATTHQVPKERQQLEEVRLMNRQKAQQILLEANTQQFRCANPQKSERAKNTISQILQSREAELKFDTRHTSGIPATHKTNNMPIRLNTTAVLREGALYNKQVEEELQRLTRLAEGTKEPSAFLRWQREVRERDLREELARLESRRLEGRIDHEEAAMARQRLAQLNQDKVQRHKEETAELMRRYAQQRLQEESEMKELVQQVAEGHKNSKAAKAKLKALKQEIVRDVSEQNRELLRQALEEAQAELSRKFELIRQIRAIESLPLVGDKLLDDTQTPGHELLCEMSLAELRERLVRLRDWEQKEQQDRRLQILEEKHTKEQLLLGQLGAISLHRATLGQAAIRRQEEKAARLGLQQAAREDERVLALQKKLEVTKQERARRKQEAQAKAKTGKQVAAHTVRSVRHRKQVLEEQHWRELERSLEQQVRRGTVTN